MRRLKEGFYNIMKLADAVKARGQEAKAELVEYSRNNKLEKPVTEAIIRFKTTLEENPVEVNIQVGEDENSAKVVKGAGKKKKKGGAAGPSALFKKKLQLKLAAGEGNGEKEEGKTEEVKVEDEISIKGIEAEKAANEVP